MKPKYIDKDRKKLSDYNAPIEDRSEILRIRKLRNQFETKCRQIISSRLQIPMFHSKEITRIIFEEVVLGLIKLESKED